MTKRIFITGEHGMIACAASHHFLLDSEFELVNWAYDGDDTKTFYAAYKDASLKELDITKSQFTNKVIATRPDYVVHTAAYVNTDSCEQSPKECIDSNVFGTWQAIQSANRVNATLIFIGTTATYDLNTSKNEWIIENTLQNPKTIYGITKYDSELLVRNYSKKFFILRPCFAFGGILDSPIQSVDSRLYLLRDTSSNITKLIYNHIMQIIDCPKFTLGLQFLKDYMSVDDVGRAIYLAAKNDWTGIYNISRMSPLTWQHYCELIYNELTLSGFSNKIYFDSLGEKDYLRNHCVDSSRLRSLGWQPAYSFLDVVRFVILKICNYEIAFNESVLNTHR